jgi:filamentous hemagglutinin
MRKPIRFHASHNVAFASRPLRWVTARRARGARNALLGGTSAIALLTMLTAATPAHARCLFCSVGAANAAAQAEAAALAGAAQAAAAALQSQAALARASQSIQAMMAVQARARALAVAGPNNLGLDPNHPGQLLLNVPDGMSMAGAGGLVPDSGFASPGVANPVSTWVGANTPTQSTSGGQTVVTINQTAAQALLNWTTFNVGKNTVVNFNQGASTWVALNRIMDPSGSPSQILGQINAPGQVYVINQNGIIFGGSSQINVGTLIASSLDLVSYTNFLNGNGIVSTGVTDKTPSFQGTSSSGTVTIQAGGQLNAPSGNVLLLAPSVENDGAISTPSGQTLLLGGSDVLLANGDSHLRGFVISNNPTTSSGYVNNNLPSSSFFASLTPGAVINNGSISAPQGNITIVAGKVNQNGVLTSTTSTTNNGSIIIWAETGALVLGGPNDNPLYAGYGVTAQPSLMQILPEASDQSQITDSQAITNSAIALTGVDVDIRGIVQLQGYAVTNANNQLAVASGPLNNSSAPGIAGVSTGITITATGSTAANVHTPGQVFLENGSLLDSEGTTDAVASASRNSVAVELRTNELADDPLLRNSSLYQQTIYVDASVFGTNPDGTIWQGTDIANAQGWIGLITRSLDERLMNGAPITIGGVAYPGSGSGIADAANLVQNAGSIINVSGGYMTYTPGFVRVSELVDQYGRLVSVSNANPNDVYAGVCCSFTVDHSHWGASETFSGMLGHGGYFAPGYIQGGAGGSLTLDVAASVLDGQIESTVVAGDRQRTLASAPQGATLTLNSVNPSPPINPNLVTTGTDYNTDQITLSDAAAAAAAEWTAGFTIGADGSQVETPLTNLLPANSAGTKNSVYMPASWLNSGFTTVNLAANGKISLPAGNNITMPAGGSITLKANAVDIESSIIAPDGTIALPGAFTLITANDMLATQNPNSSFSARSGQLTIGPDIILSTAGLWTNDAGATSLAPMATSGGKITLGAYGDIEIGQGSVIDVSAGAYESVAGKVTMGSAGTLTITAGLAPPSKPPDINDGIALFPNVSDGVIHFDGGLEPGQLRGYGGAGNGGTLALTSYEVATITSASQMGGALMLEGAQATDALGHPYTPLAVSTDFFSAGGFASISLTTAGMNLPANVTLTPTVSSQLVVNPQAPSAGSLSGLVRTVLFPALVRPAASISLEASGDLWYRGGPNASTAQDTVDTSTYSLNIAGTIAVDPKGSVSLTGDQVAIVSGTVLAPGGSIALAGGTYTTPAGNPGDPADPSMNFQQGSPQASLALGALLGEGVWLTSTGRLLAAGAQVIVPQSNGSLFSDVLPGGVVSVSGGDLVLARGSVIDVSGAAGQSTLLAAGAFNGGSSLGFGSRLLSTAPIASDGGTISISAVLGAALEGTLLGQAGGAGAVGGTLSVAMAVHDFIVYAPSGASIPVNIPTGFWPAGEPTTITLQPTVSDSQIKPGDANVATKLNANIPLSTTMISSGGFGSLTLITPSADSGEQGYVTFSKTSNVSLSLPGQLTILGSTIMAPPGMTDTLSANYVLWLNNGALGQANVGAVDPTQAKSWLSIIANTVDLVGNLGVQGANNTTLFDVSGDLRLSGVTTNPTGSLMAAGDLIFEAGQIYPTTDTTFTLASTTSITFLANGAPPPTPLSAGGTLNVIAPTINQSGTLRAPLGTINLGTSAAAPVLDASASGSSANGPGIWIFSATAQNFAIGASVDVTSADGLVQLSGLVVGSSSDRVTVEVVAASGPISNPKYQAEGSLSTWNITSNPTANITLGKGSLTSVSANGLIIPFGTTTNAASITTNTTWTYDPSRGNGTSTTVTAPPSKLITMNGGKVTVAQGATIDESGGGDLYASEFVPGTGGSKDIFAGANVYAVIPGYVGITPYDPSISSGSPSIGRQVYLNGVPGLAAGFYTLLPGQYAQLPGAFLITVQSAPAASTAAVTRAPVQPVTLADGSEITSGYFVAAGSGATDPHWSVFKVMSSPVARQYSQIVDNFASSFFPALAAVKGTAVPRLPQDGGQLAIDAGTSLVFQGTTSFAPAAGGLGGLADISGNQILVVDNSTRDALAANPNAIADEQQYKPSGDPDAWAPLVLGAGDLSKLGVESLLLGGSRSFQSDGVHVTPIATALVVANDAADSLTLPDIQLIAGPRLISTSITATTSGASVTLVSAAQGTGQVVIESGAVIRASGAVTGGESSVILPQIIVPPPPTGGVDSTGYSRSDIEAYYLAVAEDQVGYVRVSNAGLTTINRVPTFTGFPTGTTLVDQDNFVLPVYATNNGSLTINAGAQLTSSGSILLYANTSGTIAAGVSIATNTLEVRSGTTISLGTDSPKTAGVVLDQGAIAALSGISNLILMSASEIDIYGALNLGKTDPTTGQPILASLTLDSAGLVEQSAGTATFMAEQVTIQNSLGGTISQPTNSSGGQLVISAVDVTAKATDANNAQISLGTGAFTIAGFSSVDLHSTGQIVVTGDNGSLTVEANLTLDAPRISGGTMSMVNGLPQFSAAAYTINAVDNLANPTTYYAVNLVNSSGAEPALPAALLGNSLTINAADINIDTSVVLPGGAFNATANNGGSITVGTTGVVDVSGQAIQFVDVLASIGGGNINLTSTSGAVAIQSGAVLNVGDLNDIGAVNKNSAGTLTLAAPKGGVTIAAGTLHGEAGDADNSGSFVLDTNNLSTTAAESYDTIASLLVAGGFQKSWNIRATSGDIAMTGQTVARSVTVSADSGQIDVTGTIDAHGATPGQINLWAGTNLILESSAVLNARGDTADANGRGGQALLAASQEGNQQGTLELNVGATIDVTAVAANSTDTGPLFGGQVTFETSRTATNDGVMLSVSGGTFAQFLSGINGKGGVIGESAWDGVVVVGNQTYTYNQPSLVITPFVSTSGSVVFNAYLTANSGYAGDSTYSAAQYNATNAASFMSDSNQAAMWNTFGANGSGVVGGVLVNIRPGIVIKNSGSVTIAGDSTNRNGIDLSGSAYAGSVLNTGDEYSLDGHFGQYNEPIVLALRAGGNLNFGSCTGGCLTASSASAVTLGSLSDGFWQYYAGSSGRSPLYANEITGGGASGAATLFDPASTNNGISGGLGADSATYFLTAGADITAANPSAIAIGATTGTLTVAGLPGTSAATADPLYVYNYDTNNGVATKTLANFTDFASLVRTGTGNITISTAKDVVLQSPLSLIYTAGTGFNVNGTSDQPLSGFQQYNGWLDITGRSGAFDSLPASVFPTYGGDVNLAVGGNIVGDMNGVLTNTTKSTGTDQELPYDMTALGSQAKLQNLYGVNGFSNPLNFGAFGDLYATDAWLASIGSSKSFYTAETPSSGPATPGNYQLAWYTWFPFLENTIGSFGGGNIRVTAGGSITNVQFVSPTNARDAGPYLVSSRYNTDQNLLNWSNTSAAAAGIAAGLITPVTGYDGLYVQGGGNITVAAGANIANVYTYAQNGSTSLQAGLSASNLVLETSTGNVSVQASRSISIADRTVQPSVTSNQANAVTLSGISLIQNGSFLVNIRPPVAMNQDQSWWREITALTGILTSAPTGTVTLQAVEDVNLDVGIKTQSSAPGWNTLQGILPAQLHVISLQGNVTNGSVDSSNDGSGTFITYPAANGTVDMLARDSLLLNAGFVLSDANPSVMPTLDNIAAALDQPQFLSVITSVSPAQSMLTTTTYQRISASNFPLGGANFLPGQDSSYAVLGGDTLAQLLRDPISPVTPPPASVEADRHGNLHVGDNNPARLIALDGDVTMLGTPVGGGGSPILNLAKAVEIFAGRDVFDLALIGQNNNATDVTSIIAGRDVSYQTVIVPTFSQNFGVEIGGPGNLVIESGRNVDLGNSTGIETFGNFLNPSMKSTMGASITIYTGLGSPLGLPDYSDFTTNFVNSATAGQYAEPLDLFDAQGHLISTVSLTPPEGPLSIADQLLLNRIFFGLVRDSGREHTGAVGGGNYELFPTGAAIEFEGAPVNGTIDTAGVLNVNYANYERAFAAINSFFGRTSSSPYGSGDFLGGLSTVRTLGGGNITILAPHGQIEVGLVTTPAGFTYSKSNDPLWALNFGIVTERGGDVDLYADGNISVNQSRIFTLEGGDMTIVSREGNIDAGKGAKTVLAIQPPSVTFDPYGNVSIAPYGPASGSGIAVLRALPDVPVSNVDLVAFVGSVNAGDAGIRVSGNINIAAVVVLNAANIQVGGTATGVPTVVAPNIAALTSASNTAGASTKTVETPSAAKSNDQPSIIIVEFLGFGGGEGDSQQQDAPQKDRRSDASDAHHYDSKSSVQFLGLGNLSENQSAQLTSSERQNLKNQAP